MTIHSNFRPQFGATQTVTPAAASASITIGKGCKTIRVRNTGANIGYFRTGNSANGALTAVSAAGGADMPVTAGETVYIAVDDAHDTLAHISPTGTTFVITPGDGGVGSGS